MPRKFADIVRRVSKGYDLPPAEARALLGRPVFTISIDDLRDEEASDVFVLRPSWGDGISGAVAGEFSRVVLFNPDASGVLATLEHVSADVGADQSVRLGNADVDIGVGDVPGFRDRRIVGFPAVEIQTATNAANQIVPHRTIQLTAGTTVELLTSPILLEPGTGLGIEGNTVNDFVRVNFIWREETN